MLALRQQGGLIGHRIEQSQPPGRNGRSTRVRCGHFKAAPETGERISFNECVEVLAVEPAALRRRALRAWLLAGGITALTADHLLRLDRLVTAPAATASVRLPGAIDAVVRGGLLRFQPIG